MLTHSYYEEDPRVRREAESLAAAGHEVSVIALRRPGDPPAGELDGVAIRRLDVQRHQGAGLGVYLAEYLSFLVRSGWALVRSHRRRRVDVVQVHSLPDFLAFAALPLRVVGVPLLLDLHEAMPEFFRTRFPRASNPLAHRLLLLQERLSIAIASATLTVNEALADRLRSLGVAPDRVHVVHNHPALARFDPSTRPLRAFRADGNLRLVYAGALTPTYELDVAVDAVAAIARERPDLDIRFDLYGRGDSADALRDQAAILGVDDRLTFHGRIPIEAVPAAIADADIGLAPTRRSPFTDMSLSTKVFEYAAMDKAVVATRLPMVEATFPDGSVAMYEPGDAASLAAAIVRLADDGTRRTAAVREAGAVARSASWEAESARYAALVEGLARRTSSPEPAA
jgi:glycosyltransferase involved in cell wall biosynthesis